VWVRAVVLVAVQAASWHFNGGRQVVAWIFLGLGWWLTAAVVASVTRLFTRK
jgi:hypothetical protein